MPAVDHGGELDGLASVFGVVESALPLGFVEGLEEHDPAGVEAFDEFEGPLYGGGAVVEGGPGGLVVGFDGRPVLGQSEADADEGVHVAVCKVVDYLAERPAAGAVGGVQLSVGQALNGVAEFAGQVSEGCDGTEPLVYRDDFGSGKFSNGVARVEIGSRHVVPLESA